MRRRQVNRLTRRVIQPLLLVVPAILMSSVGIGVEGVSQRVFSSPRAAGDALAAALKADDESALATILGGNSRSLLDSGDPVADQREYGRFVTAYEDAHDWTDSGTGTSILEIGEKGWPFPVPLVGGENGWRFDSERGADEILNRRIGRNELGTIQACLAFVDAEREYYQRNPRGRATLEYARFILSREGKKDGLYWERSGDAAPSPLGWAYASARSQGYSLEHGKAEPFHGYLYRVLHAQGAQAPGGAYEYTEGDEMTRGFALIAWPAKYGASGVMTFIVNQLGLVYEKDLGSETGTVAAKLAVFDPDETWAIVPADAQALPDAAGVGG